MVKLRGVWQRSSPSWQTLEIEEDHIFYLFKHSHLTAKLDKCEPVTRIYIFLPNHMNMICQILSCNLASTVGRCKFYECQRKTSQKV